MTQPLAGQKILLIGIGFYDYEAAIAAEFRSLGAEVWIENEQPPEWRGPLAPLRRRLPVDGEAALRRHRAAMLARAHALGALDHVVIIKGALLDEDFLLQLRRAQPRVRLTAYHWDSMARFPDLVRRQALFDRVLTFDHSDADQFGFILRPLFYRPELSRTAPGKPRIDLCFTGWLHHDRLRQIEAVRTQARLLGLSTSFYLSTGAWTSVKLRLGGRGQGVYSRPQSFEDYVANTLAARAILDLPHPQQTGLTMRAIEAVGAGRKLITTANDIRRYDFYRSENVQVLDGADPRIDADFLAAQAAPLPQDIQERYSLRAWALDVLGIVKSRGFIRAA